MTILRRVADRDRRRLRHRVRRSRCCTSSYRLRPGRPRPAGPPQAIADFNRATATTGRSSHQFLNYVSQTLHGNFGYSYKLNQSVNVAFKANAGVAPSCPGTSLVLAVVIAIPLGIFQAIKRN